MPVPRRRGDEPEIPPGNDSRACKLFPADAGMNRYRPEFAGVRFPSTDLFPADAGMNRESLFETRGNAGKRLVGIFSVPRRRGDEPMCSMAATCKTQFRMLALLFPADAGMNRDGLMRMNIVCRRNNNQQRPVPRRRGDEPLHEAGMNAAWRTPTVPRRRGDEPRGQTRRQRRLHRLFPADAGMNRDMTENSGDGARVQACSPQTRG